MDQYKTLRFPSVTNGDMSEDEERLRRFQGCTFIEYLGCRLKAPQPTVATAMVFFHRFYTRHSFSIYKPEILAATCMFLAGKVEEPFCKIDDIVSLSMAHLYTWGKSNEEKAKMSFGWRDAIVRYEIIVLETLCFDLSVDHPYEPLFDIMRELQASESMIQSAMGFANDSLRLPVCLIHEPKLIAAACVMLSYRLHHQQLPDNKISQLMQLIDKHFVSLQAIIREIMLGYSIPNQFEQYNATSRQRNSRESMRERPVSGYSRERHQVYRLNDRSSSRTMEHRGSINRLQTSALPS
ncbi:cyclin-like protein [Lichtheimia hyalospora FSU 10163]|nr:cyclin-like protein [Lichtheimia hyalospora FSU 10163]